MIELLRSIRTEVIRREPKYNNKPYEPHEPYRIVKDFISTDIFTTRSAITIQCDTKVDPREPKEFSEKRLYSQFSSFLYRDVIHELNKIIEKYPKENPTYESNVFEMLLSLRNELEGKL